MGICGISGSHCRSEQANCMRKAIQWWHDPKTGLAAKVSALFFSFLGIGAIVSSLGSLFAGSFVLAGLGLWAVRENRLDWPRRKMILEKEEAEFKRSCREAAFEKIQEAVGKERWEKLPILNLDPLSRDRSVFYNIQFGDVPHSIMKGEVGGKRFFTLKLRSEGAVPPFLITFFEIEELNGTWLYALNGIEFERGGVLRRDGLLMPIDDESGRAISEIINGSGTKELSLV